MVLPIIPIAQWREAGPAAAPQLLPIAALHVLGEAVDVVLRLPSAIVKDVLKILPTEHYVTAYQILHRLPAAIQSKLIAGRGRPGAHSGRYYTSATDVAKAAEMLVRTGKAEKTWLDTKDLRLECEGKTIEAGNPSCALYRAIS